MAMNLFKLVGERENVLTGDKTFVLVVLIVFFNIFTILVAVPVN